MRDDQKRALLADGGKGEAVPLGYIHYEAEENIKDGGYVTLSATKGKTYTVPVYTAPQAECAPREATLAMQSITLEKMVVASIAKCEPEEDGSLSVNELFAMQAENAAPTPKLYAHPIASADELIDRGSSK